jgi:hypothetical protein
MAFTGILAISIFAATSLATFFSCPVVVFTAKIFAAGPSRFSTAATF